MLSRRSKTTPDGTWHDLLIGCSLEKPNSQRTSINKSVNLQTKTLTDKSYDDRIYIEVIIMKDLSTALRDTISISSFNKGKAGKVFSEVKDSGAKIVIKNNVPECVLLSPEEYLSLMDEVYDARLAIEANNRLNDYDSEKLVSQAFVDEKFGFSADDLENFEEVEFE